MYSSGPHPAPLPDEALLVLRLAEVGMEPHAQILWLELRTAAAAPRETLKGEQGASATMPHGEPRMDHGRSPPARLTILAGSRPRSAQHCPAAGRRPSRLRSMLPREAYIRMPRSSAAANCASEQLLRLSRRENVMVVKAGGAAVFHQFPHAGDGAVADHPAVQILPDLVQGLQPVEQLQILYLRQIAAERSGTGGDGC